MQKKSDKMSLTIQQRRAYALHYKAFPKPLMNIAYRIIFKGILSRTRVEEALKQLLIVYPCINTRICIENNSPYKYISNERIPLFFENATSLKQANNNAVVEAEKTFELIEQPLFYLKMWTVNSTNTLLLVKFHHILADGVSAYVIIETLRKVYMNASNIKKMSSELVCHHETQNALNGNNKNGEKFWDEYLSTCKTRLEIPTDYPRPKEQDFSGTQVSITLDKQISYQIDSFALKNRLSSLSVYISAYALLLSRLSQSKTFFIGTVLSNTKNLLGNIGFNANTIAVKTEIEEKTTVFRLLQKIQHEIELCYDYQDSPFENSINYDEQISNSPLLFPAMLILHHNVPVINNDWGDVIQNSISHIQMPCSQYELTTHIYRHENTTKLIFEFATALFSKKTIQLYANYYKKLLLEIIDSKSEKKVCELMNQSINTIREFGAIIKGKNRRKKFKSLCTRINELAQLEPNAYAVKDEHNTLTYKELDALSDKLAAGLQYHGIKKGDIIALYLNRGVEYVISLIGTWKCGACFIPVEPTMPLKRVQKLLSSVDCRAIIFNKVDDFIAMTNLNKFDYKSLIICDLKLDKISLENNDIAYILNTSGTTGKPKSVCVIHKGLNNLCSVFSGDLDIKLFDRILQYANISFDASIWEICMALFCGSCLYIISDEIKLNVGKFKKFLLDNKISVVTLPPQIISLLDPVELKPLRLVIAAGSASYAHEISRWLKYAKYVNAYGPTETTICASLWFATKNEIALGKVYIGDPIANSEILIMSPEGKIVPKGAIGELCISGDNLSAGYYNSLDIKSSSYDFIQHPLEKEKKLYRTGDLARIDVYGKIEYLGRCAYQFKFNGIRIDPMEIENAMLSLEGISQVAVVLQKMNGMDLLCAFYCSSEELNECDIRKYLLELFPSYMVPTYFAKIDKLPQTINGKVDYFSLPLIKTNKNQSTQKNTNWVVKRLYKLWEKTLKKSPNYEESFFLQGGSSVQLIILHQSIEEEYKVEIPVAKLFEFNTLKDMAELIKSEIGISSCKFDTDKILVNDTKMHSSDIAIIGMSGRFPCSDNIEEFWQNIKKGKNCITNLHDYKNNTRDYNYYVESKGKLKNIESFDANFFDYSDQEVLCLDDQIKLSLECAWRTFEDAGYDPMNVTATTGVFTTASFKESQNLKEDGCNINEEIQNLILSQVRFLSSTIAYKLNLMGPTVFVDTACSSSLSAVYLATNSLVLGECDVALVGGASVTYNIGYEYVDGSILSRDGICRPFDKNASGTVPGNGVGFVLLKRKEDAIRDRDHIYSVINAISANNDGSEKPNFSSPNLKALTEVMKKTYKKIGNNTNLIYAEAHGSGTILGDAIEFKAFEDVYNNCGKHKICLGSVKGNIGHLDAAAGIASLIKATLILYNRYIPPNVKIDNYEEFFNSTDSCFYIEKEGRSFNENEKSGYLAVNSFGLGGTNVHLLMSGGFDNSYNIESTEDAIIPMSAKTLNSLLSIKQKIGIFVEKNNISLQQLAFTLQRGRKHFSVGEIYLVSSIEEFLSYLKKGQPTAVRGLGTSFSKLCFYITNENISIIQNICKYLYRTNESYKASIKKGCLSGISWYVLLNKYFNRNFESSKCNYETNCALCYSFFAFLIRLGVYPSLLIGKKASKEIVSYLGEFFSISILLEEDNESYPFGFSEVIEGSLFITDASYVSEKYEYESIISLLDYYNEVNEFSIKKFICELWGKGINIDFEYLGVNESNRISLPTYSFDEVRHLKKTEIKTTSKLEEENNILNWFYTPVWKKCVFTESSFCKEDLWIVITEKARKYEQIIDTFEQYGQKVYVFELATNNYKINSNYEFDLGFSSFINKKIGKKNRINILFFLHTFEKENMNLFHKRNIELLIGIVKTCYDMRLLTNVYLITQNAYSVNNEHPLDLCARSIGTLSKVFSQEYKDIRCRVIDLDEKMFDSLVINAEWFVRNFSYADNYLISAFREHKRYVQDVEKVFLNDKTTYSELKKHGRYLIVGGTGRIGTSLKKYLIEKYSAKLMIVSRNATSKYSDSNLVGDDFEKNVILFNADVTDQKSMLMAAKKMFNEYGGIDGIFFCVGQANLEMISTLDEFRFNVLERQISHMKNGLPVIDIIVKKYHPSFCLIFSSIASVLGGIGQGIYIAGISYAEAFIEKQNETDECRWICANIDTWDLTEEVESHKHQLYELRSNQLGEKGGLQVVEILLNQKFKGVIYVSTNDLYERVKKWSSWNSFENNYKADKIMFDNTENIAKNILNIWRSFFNRNVELDDDFYDLGGDSLKAIELVSQISKFTHVPIRLSELLEARTVRQIVFILNQKEQFKKEKRVPPDRISINYPVTVAQNAMISQKNQVYDMRFSLGKLDMVCGKLNIKKFENALQAVIEKHEALRTQFVFIGDVLKQKICKDVKFNLMYYFDKSIEQMKKEFFQPFDLSRAPLLRVAVLQIADEQYAIFYDIHHIIYDEVSVGIIMSDLWCYYNYGCFFYSKNDKSFVSYALQQEEYLLSTEANTDLKYWEDELSDMLMFDLKTDNLCRGDSKCDSFQWKIEQAELLNIVAYCKKNGHTLLSILISIWMFVFHTFSKKNDISVGLRVSTRNDEYYQNTVGCFLEKIVLRTDYNKENIEQFLTKCCKKIVLGIEHSKYPYELLLKYMKDKYLWRDDDLFTILINGTTYSKKGLIMPKELKIVTEEIKPLRSKYSINLKIHVYEQEVIIRLKYQSSRYSKQDIKQLFDIFNRTINKLLEENK